jgi:hypothetical protein
MSHETSLSQAVGSTDLRQSQASRKASEARSQAVGTRSRFPPIPPKGFRLRFRRIVRLNFNRERRLP